MLRIISAAAGALAGFAVGVAFRPTVFGEQVPLDVILSDDVFDEPYRDLILQNLLLAMAAGSAVALLLLPSLVGRWLPASAVARPGALRRPGA
jgi:hypothetical protein